MIVSTLKVGKPRPKRQSRHRPILNCWRGSHERRQLVLKQAAVFGLMQNGLSDLVLLSLLMGLTRPVLPRNLL